MIQGWVGLIGAGKTMCAVEQAVKLAKRRGALLASNIKVTAPGVDVQQLATGDDGLDLEELAQLVADLRAEGRGLVLLLDEVGILMPARMWASFPVSLMFTLSQSRKLKLDLIYTSQDIEQVDAFLRRLTQWVWKVRAWPAPSLERSERGRRPWLLLVNQWRPATIEKVGQRVSRSLRRYPRHVEPWYDTDELVSPARRLTRSKGRRQAETPAVVVVPSPAPVPAPRGPVLAEWPTADA
jgi:hypothetical protein